MDEAEYAAKARWAIVLWMKDGTQIRFKCISWRLTKKRELYTDVREPIDLKLVENYFIKTLKVPPAIGKPKS